VLGTSHPLHAKRVSSHIAKHSNKNPNLTEEKRRKPHLAPDAKKPFSPQKMPHQPTF